MNINVNEYPELQQLCWNRPGDAAIDGETAFALYERYWRFVDVGALEGKERELLDELVRLYGHGHLLFR